MGRGCWSARRALLVVVALVCAGATTPPEFVSDLPPDVQSVIASLVPESALVGASAVSRAWRSVLKPLLYQCMIRNMHRVASDGDAGRLTRLVGRMSDDDRRLLGAAFGALKPCTKISQVRAILSAVATRSVSATRAKAVVQLLPRIGVPSRVLVGAFMQAEFIYAWHARRMRCLWAAVLDTIPVDDPIRGTLSLNAMWTLPPGSPFKEALQADVETWVAADDARRTSLILHGFDCNKLLPELSAKDVGRLHERFGFVPDANDVWSLPTTKRIAVADEFVKRGVPMATVTQYADFQELIDTDCEAALRFARRYHPRTDLGPGADGLVQMILRQCPERISKMLLPLVVAGDRFNDMQIVGDSLTTLPLRLLGLLLQLGRMFSPATPTMNILIEYLGVARLGRVPDCDCDRARLPLPALFADFHPMLLLLRVYLRNIPPGVSVLEADAGGRTSLHALGDVIARTGWTSGYGEILEIILVLAGAEASSGFIARQDHRSRTFLDIVGGNLDDLVECLKSLAGVERAHRLDLFSKVALPAVVSDRGRTVLHHPDLYCNGHLPPQQFVLSRPELLDVLDNDGHTVVHLAVANACYQAAEWYLAIRPDLLFVPDGAGQTVLHRIGPTPNAIPMVLVLGSQPMDPATAMHFLSQRDHAGKTAMEVALSKDDSEAHHKASLHMNRVVLD